MEGGKKSSPDAKKSKTKFTPINKITSCCNHHKCYESSAEYRTVFIETVKTCLNCIMRLQNSLFSAEQWFQDVFVECSKEYKSQCKNTGFEQTDFTPNCMTFKESYAFFYFFFIFFLFIHLFFFFFLLRIFFF